ncbi:MAG: molybdopterin molybdotransferase MoeA [Cellvibrionaceae bacterium]
MLSVEDAIAKILARAEPTTETEVIPLNSAFHRVLAKSQIAKVNVPPADNSAMDGYAIHTDSLKNHHNESFVVSQRIAAGQIAKPLEKNTVARIFTGSEIPCGANAVIMQENCEADPDNQSRIFIKHRPSTNDHIRKQGQDIEKGSELFHKGHKLHATDLGVLASCGIAEITAYKKLTVGVLTTGDELIPPGEKLSTGQIYNSNEFTLKGLLDSLQIEMVSLGHIPDTFTATVTALADAAKSVDIVLSTGGVSVGEEDHIKSAIETLGEISLWKLAIKPGKPLAFGRISNTPFFGLPGNPVSVLVTFLIVVRPFLLKAQGHSDIKTNSMLLPADFSMTKNSSRQEYLRVRINDGKLTLFNNQSSGVLTSASWANALAIVPINTTIQPGDLLETIPFNQLGI